MDVTMLLIQRGESMSDIWWKTEPPVDGYHL